MSHLRSFLFAFLVLGVIVSGLAATGDICQEEVNPSTDYPKLSPFEEKLKYLKELKDKLQGWFYKKQPEEAEIAPLNFVATINSFPEVEPAQLIPPGMKWCGDGDRADHEDDVGIYFRDTDICCRGHDLCKTNVHSGEMRKNLNNTAMFTRSACKCDVDFYNCLKKVNSIVSNSIGKLYFNKLEPQCFKCICPVDIANDNDGTEDNCERYAWRNTEKY